jgi:hypothetical protein
MGFLPAWAKHPPAIIAAFGVAHELEPGVLAITEDLVRAVHLTRIKGDGSGKADDRQKMMIGRPMGSTIVLGLRAFAQPPNLR